MAKSPSFSFYSSDFITGTLLMTNEQVGKYIKLLCLQHQTGHLSKEDMLNICGAYDKRVFSKFILDDAGMYYNERLEIEMVKRSKYCENQRDNVRKRWDKINTKEIPLQYKGNTNVLPLENEDVLKKEEYEEKEQKTKQLTLHTNGFITPTLFDTFWKMYPRKTDKGKALSKWNQLCAKKENRPTWHEIKNAIRQQQKSDRWQNPTFIPMPTTWLNQSRWLDDPEQMTSFNFEKDELTTCPMGFNFGEDHGSYAGCDKCESSHLKIWTNCKADYLKHTR